MSPPQFSSEREENYVNCHWLRDPVLYRWIKTNIDSFGRSAIDIGCADGDFTLFLADAGWKMIGCDPSTALIEKAKNRTNPNASFVVSSAELLPLESDSVDIAIAKSSLHHFDNVTMALDEMCRVSRNVIAVLEVVAPSENCLPYLKEILSLKEPDRDTSSTVYTESSLMAVVDRRFNIMNSMIFDQFLPIEQWLRHSDIDVVAQRKILNIANSQPSSIANSMQFHERNGELHQLRRMNLVIGHSNE